MYDYRKEKQREATRELCRSRGINIKPKGQCYLLTGVGVSVLIADLADVGPTDIAPYLPRKHVEA